ncbi:MAG: hypothetical protein EA360_00470 [Balneolaceae bacterium]|jgi:hypothetical protein|nr:MAG: hypothetical protein EA360_00470 [Balneolaceae bacterium]
MSGTVIAIIALAAIIGGYIIDYQKNKLKWQAEQGEAGRDTDELRGELQRLTRRIEHLEAIVTDESFDEQAPYSTQSRAGEKHLGSDGQKRSKIKT